MRGAKILFFAEQMELAPRFRLSATRHRPSVEFHDTGASCLFLWCLFKSNADALSVFLHFRRIGCRARERPWPSGKPRNRRIG